MRRQGAWSLTHEIAALTFERQDLWAYLHAQQWGGKPGRLPDPMGIEHPDRPEWDDGRRKTTNDPDEIRRFFSGQGR